MAALSPDSRNLLSPADCSMSCMIFPRNVYKSVSPRRTIANSVSTSTLDTDMADYVTNASTPTSLAPSPLTFDDDTPSPRPNSGILRGVGESMMHSVSFPPSVAERREPSTSQGTNSVALTSLSLSLNDEPVLTKRVAFHNAVASSTDVTMLSGDEAENGTAKMPSLGMGLGLGLGLRAGGEDAGDHGEMELKHRFYRHRQQPTRKSLLGKPINFPLHRRDARIRRTQATVYNFLERPKDWRSISYHLLV